MSTWRNLTFMRRRQMRLMADEQQRAQRRQLMAQALALADVAASMQAAQGVTLVDWADALDDEQMHLLRAGLH